MKDTDLGTRDKRGFWKPNELITYSPLIKFPIRFLKILTWLFLYPGYLFPWGAFFIILSTVLWLYFTPSLDIHEPKKRFKVIKCNQNNNKKLSVEKVV